MASDFTTNYVKNANSSPSFSKVGEEITFPNFFPDLSTPLKSKPDRYHKKNTNLSYEYTHKII